MIVPRGLVSFTTEKLALGPSQAVSALLQLSASDVSLVAAGSVGSEPAEPVAVGDASNGSVVGDGIEVNVGSGVGLAASVGGIGVLVGIAC